MELDLMFVGSESILDRCRQPRRELMRLVSAAIKNKSYGTSIEFMGVNVLF